MILPSLSEPSCRPQSATRLLKGAPDDKLVCSMPFFTVVIISHAGFLERAEDSTRNMRASLSAEPPQWH